MLPAKPIALGRFAPTPQRSRRGQIPIAARGTAACPTSRDFVPWRFSDAGRRSAWIDRHPGVRKPAQKPAMSNAAKQHVYSITSSARSSECGGNFEAERLRGLEIDDQLEFGRLLDRQIGGLRAA